MKVSPRIDTTDKQPTLEPPNVNIRRPGTIAGPILTARKSQGSVTRPGLTNRLEACYETVPLPFVRASRLDQLPYSNEFEYIWPGAGT